MDERNERERTDEGDDVNEVGDDRIAAGCGEGDPEEGPPDPGLDPTRSPGFGDAPPIEEIDVGRDVTLGEATPRELTASDTAPVANDAIASVIETLERGDPTERRRAALALSERTAAAGEEVTAALARAARTDEDADVRQFAVEALAAVGGERAAATARAACEDGDPWVRAEAVVALDRLDRAAHEEVIEECLDDDHHAVRRNAAVSLFKRRGEALLPTLLDLAEDDAERVREWAAHLLGGIDDERASEALRSLAGNEDESDIVRTTAARAIEADPQAFRRQFAGTQDDPGPRPGEDMLNRRPDL